VFHLGICKTDGELKSAPGCSNICYWWQSSGQLLWSHSLLRAWPAALMKLEWRQHQMLCHRIVP